MYPTFPAEIIGTAVQAVVLLLSVLGALTGLLLADR
mgnify:CR=1 FL=1|jgi:hypothetical protein